MVKQSKAHCLVLLAMLVVTQQVASSEDWQHCKPDGQYSFVELKSLVRSATTIHGYSGWYEKAFSRAGDQTAVAILQSLSDPEMASPEALNYVLLILHLAFDAIES
jgi:hypothetical protein